MEINALIEFLLNLKEAGKGDYIVVDGELLKEIKEEYIIVDDFNKEIKI